MLNAESDWLYIVTLNDARFAAGAGKHVESVSDVAAHIVRYIRLLKRTWSLHWAVLRSGVLALQSCCR